MVSQYSIGIHDFINEKIKVIDKLKKKSFYEGQLLVSMAWSGIKNRKDLTISRFMCLKAHWVQKVISNQFSCHLIFDSIGFVPGE